MKTAVSIPDPIYASAEQLARRLQLSRSALYARAVESYVQKHEGDPVTKALNEVYDHVDSRLDPVMARQQARALPQDKW